MRVARYMDSPDRRGAHRRDGIGPLDGPQVLSRAPRIHLRPKREKWLALITAPASMASAGRCTGTTRTLS